VFTAALALTFAASVARATPDQRLALVAFGPGPTWSYEPGLEAWMRDQGLADDGMHLEQESRLIGSTHRSGHPWAQGGWAFGARGSYRILDALTAGLVLVRELGSAAGGHHAPDRYLQLEHEVTTVGATAAWDLGWLQLATGPALMVVDQRTLAVTDTWEPGLMERVVESSDDERRAGPGWVVEAALTVPEESRVFFFMLGQARAGGRLVLDDASWDDTQLSEPYSVQGDAFTLLRANLCLGLGLRFR
jgi:hypothetical protein